MRARKHSILGLAIVLTAGLGPVGPTSSVLEPRPAQAAEAQSLGSLNVSPSAYIGGQAVEFRGRLPVRGERRITMESHMNRPGDKWLPLPNFSATTNPDGSFSFMHPAPSMFEISFRVVSGQHATERHTFRAKTQDLSLWISGWDKNDESNPGRVIAGQKFGITVDTTPDLKRAPDTKGLPVLEGRRLTLERRAPNYTWTPIAHSTVERDGNGYFTGLVAEAGVDVYRVRQEDWTKDGSGIGWTPSFPLYVRVAENALERYRDPVETRNGPNPSYAPLTPKAGDGGAEQTAASKYRWFPSLWDFTWTTGQSLTSKPDRGTRRRGYWQDYSSGAGRVSKHNGGLYLDSSRVNGPGWGDFGTTSATLVNNARAYGRWEARLRVREQERGQTDYKVLVELVPERVEDYDCGRHNITVAETTRTGGRYYFGVKNGSRQWKGKAWMGQIAAAAPVVAAEVSKRHVSFFLNGKVVGTVKNRRASSGMPMTMRLSLVGQDNVEMNKTGLISDWQRGFGIKPGKKALGGKRLKASKLRGSC